MRSLDHYITRIKKHEKIFRERTLELKEIGEAKVQAKIDLCVALLNFEHKFTKSSPSEKKEILKTFDLAPYQRKSPFRAALAGATKLDSRDRSKFEAILAQSKMEKPRGTKFKEFIKNSGGWNSTERKQRKIRNEP